MRKSIHSEEYKCVLAMLVNLRKKAGLTQRDLARRLNREPSFVWRIEKGERRLDVVEFHWVCQALAQDTGTVYVQLLKEFPQPGPALYPLPAPIGKAADNPPDAMH